MPKLIPNSVTRIGIFNGNGAPRGSDEEETGSNDNDPMPLNEDPMNLVETSWDLSALNDNARAPQAKSPVLPLNN